MRHRSTLVFSLLLFFAVFADSQGNQASPPASNTPPDQKCVLAGHVSNAQTGEPISKATIRVQSRNGGSISSGRGNGTFQGYSATSETDGSFRIENVEPGQYTLSGTRTGFMNTQYGSKGPSSAGTTITLTPGQQVTDIAFPLNPQAVISGKVIDEDGDPISGVTIRVLVQQWMRGKLRFLPRNGSNTNDLGEYRIANLSAGKYYLSAQVNRLPMLMEPMNGAAIAGKPDIRPVRTYYPEAITRESATPIDVKPGQDLSGMNIRMHSAQTYHIRGKVVGEVTDGEGGRETVTVSNRDDDAAMSFGGPQAQIANDHSFDIAGVAPGAYNVNVMVMRGQMRVAARQQVDVGAADVNDVLLAVSPPGTITGHVRIEGTAPAGSAAANLQNLRVNLSPDGSGFSSQQQTNQDGSFVLSNIGSGKYYLNVNDPQGTYTKSVRFGQQEVLGKELDLSGSASGDVEITLRYGAPEVDGTVKAADSDSSGAAAVTSGTVVLAPDQLNADGSGLRFANIDTTGSFTAKQVPPGHYHAFALEQVDTNPLQNPDLLKELASKGVDVDLKENDKKQIQLAVIPASESQQIMARLGIESQ